ncbi:hypothetical protein SKAU_G00189670 [Synaphobranchus kaupii]|uniref:Uncharacterized protein n=1 Tax=Synaphobranchus kaupii TaxID=118154 RepID=A0A9Q1FDT5_SYNKA|nr:hypothetical protein SKAU_G00189670 [Synaphobranchus kaupii]
MLNTQLSSVLKQILHVGVAARHNGRRAPRQVPSLRAASGAAPGLGNVGSSPRRANLAKHDAAPFRNAAPDGMSHS